MLAEAPQASCPVIPAPTPSFAWVVQLFTGSLVSEVKKFISAEKKEGGLFLAWIISSLSHLPSRPANGWTSPVEGAMVKQKWDAGGGEGLDHDSAQEK